MLKIAVVEDHEESREQMLIYLRRQGWQADGTDCGEGLNELLNRMPYHIVMLDLNLPHEDGLSIAKRIKVSHPSVGVVILSARTRAADRLLGYQSGADVYLHKPVNLEEIKAVIDNLSKRLDILPLPTQYSMQLDMGKCVLITQQFEEVRLTQTEARFLRHLAQTPSNEAPTDQILALLSHPGEPAMTRESLHVHVSRIRSKVPTDSRGRKLVSAIRGFGYRLNLPLMLV